jgi:hypothetical protein
LDGDQFSRPQTSRRNVFGANSAVVTSADSGYVQ